MVAVGKENIVMRLVRPEFIASVAWLLLSRGCLQGLLPQFSEETIQAVGVKESKGRQTRRSACHVYIVNATVVIANFAEVSATAMSSNWFEAGGL